MRNSTSIGVHFETPTVRGGGIMLAKCANPACPVRFDKHREGKFFYSHPGNASKAPGNDLAGTRFHLLNVEHYWLCELCAQIFTLVAIEGDRVVLTPRCTELPAEDSATL